MSDATPKLPDAIETHDVAAIRSLLDDGLDPTAPVRGRTPVAWLLEMYTRSPRFSECMRTLLDAGGELEDPALASVLLNDPEGVAGTPGLESRRVSLRCAFTPLVDVTPLHVAVEYALTDAASALLDAGAECNAESGADGHTPIFHCVNAPRNHSLEALDLLLRQPGVRLDALAPALTWGDGFEWETTFYDVTPISYAQCGLTPQMHRLEEDVYEVVDRLLRAAGRAPASWTNVPNRYVQRSRS